MANRYYLHGGAFHVLPDGVALPIGAVEVPRLPVKGEVWADNGFVEDGEFLADAAVPASHIPTAHWMKAVEAAIILSGVTLDHGLLAEESDATGISLIELANAAYQHAEDFRAREVTRRVAKVNARGN